MKIGPVATIGYEGATMPAFLAALRLAGVDLLVDVRAVVSSRRPGFSKTPLTANLATIDVEYLHLRGLGTPPDGRAAARAKRQDELERIYRAHLATEVAQTDLEILAGLVRSGKRVALLCFEADAARCHRRFVADALHSRLSVSIVDLHPQAADVD